MNATASINYDRQYFNAFYENSIAYRSRWRRYAIPLAVILLGLAVVALLAFPSYLTIALGLCAAAIVNLIDASTYKLRWVRQNLSSFAVDKDAEVTFSDDTLRIATPNSEGTVKYDDFGVISITPNGIFLVPDTSVSLFVPRTGASLFVPRASFASYDEFGGVCSNLAEHVAQQSRND